jgi:hypothetical protein
MKKQIIIFGIGVLFICVGFSGCQVVTNSYPNDDIDLKEMILGTWRCVEVINTINGNTTSKNYTGNESVVTYYDNGTFKGEHNGSLLNWGDYEIKNNNLWLSAYGSSPYRTDIGISKDGKHLIITTIAVNQEFITYHSTARYIKLVRMNL